MIDAVDEGIVELDENSFISWGQCGLETLY